MLERQHRSLKDSLKASIEEMAEKHQDKWLDYLPFILLGKRVALQPDVGASPSELTFGKNVRIPGQLLMDPGAPPTEMELHQILSNVRNNTNKFPVQPSNHSKPEPELPGLPIEVTHVYTRQHKAVGLQAPYEGPFLIVDRPSRSTVKLKVGQFKSGEDRFEIRHLNDIKAAHPKSMAAPAQRPVLGRPSKTPGTSAPSGGRHSTEAPSDFRLPLKTGSESDSLQKSKQPTQPAAVVGSSPLNNHATSSANGRVESPSSGSEPAKIQTSGRPVRSTRNQNPLYVDAFTSVSIPPPAHKPWSATMDEVAEINRYISRNQA